MLSSTSGKSRRGKKRDENISVPSLYYHTLTTLVEDFERDDTEFNT